jgi:hypothetical protein
VDVEVRGWVLNLLGGYNVWHTDQGSVDIIAGARYLDLELDFDLGVYGKRIRRLRDVSASNGVWDAIVGVRGQANLNEIQRPAAWGEVPFLNRTKSGAP